MTRSLSRRSDPPESPRGPMKIVYVSETPFSTEHVTVISLNALSELLDDGWSVRKRERKKLKNGKKSVPVDYVELEKVKVTAAPRSVVRRDEPGDYGSRDLSEGGFGRSISHANSYLGGGSDFSGLPGVQMHSSRFTENAFGNGVDAAKLGQGIEDCPFPKEAAPRLHEEWMRGFHAGAADGEGTTPNDKVSGEEAFALGKRAAKGPPDLEVTCPYPQSSRLYKEWLRGFEEAGGAVDPD